MFDNIIIKMIYFSGYISIFFYFMVYYHKSRYTEIILFAK